jgi:hypothetical protein
VAQSIEEAAIISDQNGKKSKLGNFKMTFSFFSFTTLGQIMQTNCADFEVY